MQSLLSCHINPRTRSILSKTALLTPLKPNRNLSKLGPNLHQTTPHQFRPILCPKPLPWVFEIPKKLAGCILQQQLFSTLRITSPFQLLPYLYPKSLAPTNHPYLPKTVFITSIVNCCPCPHIPVVVYLIYRYFCCVVISLLFLKQSCLSFTSLLHPNQYEDTGASDISPRILYQYKHEDWYYENVFYYEQFINLKQEKLVVAEYTDQFKELHDICASDQNQT